MRPRGTILYENSRGTRTRDFGLHLFVCACVSDRTGVDRWTLANRQLDGIPRRGWTKVRTSYEEDLDDLRTGGAFVVAVVDADRIHPDLSSRAVHAGAGEEARERSRRR